MLKKYFSIEEVLLRDNIILMAKNRVKNRFSNKNFLSFLSSKSKLWDIFLLTIIIGLMVASLIVLRWSSIFLLVLLSANIFIYLSYRYGVSIPGISQLSDHYIQKNVQDFSKLNSPYFRFKLLYYFILLIHDIDSGFNLLFSSAKPLGINFDNRQKANIVREEYLKEALWVHHVKKKRATTATMVSSIALTVLILCLSFFFVSRVMAATFAWVQTDWSGGASTSTIATHPGDKTNWNKYYSKDDGIEASSSVALAIYSSTTIDTLTADFSAGSSTNVYVSSSGSVIALKAAKASCSTSTECALNSCVGGYCSLANGASCTQNNDCNSGSCSTTCQPCGSGTTMTDVRGVESITYPITNIASQCWMGQNLQTIYYPNGDAIVKGDSASTSAAWASLSTAYYSCPGNTANTAEDCAAATDANKLGYLYQWITIMKSGLNATSSSVTEAPGPQGICPTGWHVPTHYEVNTLELSVCGLLGKDSATCLSTFPYDITTVNVGLGTTEGTALRTSTTLGFLIPAAGSRWSNGVYYGRNASTYIWSATQYSSNVAWNRLIGTGSGRYVYTNGGYFKMNGMPVRCLKNSTTTPADQLGTNSGAFTSAVKDFGASVNLGTFSWNASTTGGVTAVTMQVRTGTTASPTGDDDVNWSAWTAISSGSTPDASLSGKRYFQYRATFTSNDVSSVATLNDVTINWSSYDRNHIVYTTVSPSDLSSNTSHSPYVVSADSEYDASRAAYKAFDGSVATRWAPTNTYGWLQIDMSQVIPVVSYRVTAQSSENNFAPKTWTLQGSNDDFSTFSILDTQTNVPSWSASETRTYNLSSMASYRYYRLNITANQGNWSLNVAKFSLGTISNTLISSIYDSGSSGNIIPKIAWTATGTSTQNNVKLQIRSSASTSTIESAPWCGYGDTEAGCTGDNYFEYNQNNITITDTNHPLMSGGDDQYFQYRIILASGGTSTPSVSDVTVTYVVNAPPEFTGDSVTASQRSSDGKVLLTYSIVDPDTASSGVNCPNCVIASFERSINGGESWTAISTDRLSNASGTTGLLAGFGTTTVSATVTSTYTVLWDAKNDGLNGQYAAETQIRITLDDLEGGNNTAVTTTASFVLDVANPTPGAYPILVNAHGATINDSNYPASLALSATDDSDSLQMCVTLSSSYSGCSYIDYNTTSSIMLTTNPQRVYVMFKDAYNNTSTASAITPDTLNNIIIKDVSDTLVPAYQEFIVWKALASTTFKYYHVEHSTDGVDYEEIDLIDDNAINFYFHQDLVLDSTHYYRVYAEDTSGNTSFYTNVVNDSADGVGGSNPNPPILTNVEVVATTTQTATIEWDTNELANSYIHYSLDPSKDFDTAVGSLTMVQDVSNIGRHRVILTDLLPGRTYNFTVESQNALSVSGVNTNEGDGYSFTTVSGPVISNVTASNVANNNATIVWNTDIVADSDVYYTSSDDFASFEHLGGTEEVTSHEIALTGLSRGTIYYYYVASGVATDNNAGDYYSFTTPYDDVAPVIDNVTSTIVIDTQALINWTTNEMSDSQVVYGTESDNYTLSSEDTNLNTNHNIVLSSLSSSTTYYYKVISTDNSGNEASSTLEYSFTTLETLSQESAILLRELQAQATGEAAGAAGVVCGGGGGGSSIDRSKPIVSKVGVSSISGDSAVVSWVTSKTANSIVQFGLDTAYKNASYGANLVTSHSNTLVNLQPSTLYHYRVNSIDENGNLGTSEDATFVTTDALGLPADASLTDSSASVTDNDSMFSAAMSRAASFISAMSGRVSINSLEAAIASQYNLIRQLSEMVPPPLLGGEPRVIVTANSATVSWSTDKESNSLVALAPDDKYDSKQGDDAYLQVIGNSEEQTNLHVVSLYDLQPETTYHYQVRSMALGGALSKSKDFTFKTRPQELEISSYNIQNVDDRTAIFRWLTTGETNSQVKYTPYRNNILILDEIKVSGDKNYTTIHEMQINEFESGVTYKIELSSTDAKGNIITKEIPDFQTGRDNYPPVIEQVQTESAISPGRKTSIQTIVSWVSNEPATGQVYYQKGADVIAEDRWNKTPLDTSFSRKHIIVITDFEPGAIYQFKIISADSNGNSSVSKVYTILTPKEKESVFQVIMKNFEDVFGWTGIGR